jgi:hypothetical protein
VTAESVPPLRPDTTPGSGIGPDRGASRAVRGVAPPRDNGVLRQLADPVPRAAGASLGSFAAITDHTLGPR